MKYYILLLLLSARWAAGQQLPDLSRYKSSSEKLQRLAILCDSLYFAQDLEGEKRLAEYALTIIPLTDYNNLARFNFFLGVVHENATSPDSSEFYYTRSKSTHTIRKTPNESPTRSPGC